MAGRRANAASRGLVYIDSCPGCGGGIEEPFLATSGPVAFVHRRKRHGSCRLIVIPAEGRAVVVAHNESLEVALLRRAGVPAA